MAVEDSDAVDRGDTEGLLRATPVYATKNLDIDDLEYDQECIYRKLPGTPPSFPVVHVTLSDYLSVCQLYVFDRPFVRFHIEYA